MEENGKFRCRTLKQAFLLHTSNRRVSLVQLDARTKTVLSLFPAISLVVAVGRMSSSFIH